MAEVRVRMLRPLGGFDVNAEREMSSTDAKRLEARGAVEVLDTKQEPAPLNKAEPPPENKAAPTRRTKLAKAG